jgi:hypothetical protein
MLALLPVGCGAASSTRLGDVLAIATAEQARSCRAGSHVAAHEVLASEAIVSVEPWHETVLGRTGAHEGALLGARVYLRALPGMTPEAVEQALRCHCAERLLYPDQTASEPARDPICSADGWVDIDVGFDRRGYIVALRGHTSRQAEALLTRMTRFAHVHPAASTPLAR